MIDRFRKRLESLTTLKNKDVSSLLGKRVHISLYRETESVTGPVILPDSGFGATITYCWDPKITEGTILIDVEEYGNGQSHQLRINPSAKKINRGDQSEISFEKVVVIRDMNGEGKYLYFDYCTITPIEDKNK